METQDATATTGSAVTAAALLAGVAACQVAIAAGAPLGAHVWGGRFEPVLPPRMRAASAASAVVLLAMATVVLVAAGRLRLGFLERRAARRITVALAAFFALNTAGNLASESAGEKVVMGSVTAALAVLLARVSRGVATSRR